MRKLRFNDQVVIIITGVTYMFVVGAFVLFWICHRSKYYFYSKNNIYVFSQNNHKQCCEKLYLPHIYLSRLVL